MSALLSSVTFSPEKAAEAEAAENIDNFHQWVRGERETFYAYFALGIGDVATNILTETTHRFFAIASGLTFEGVTADDGTQKIIGSVVSGHLVEVKIQSYPDGTPYGIEYKGIDKDN